MKLTEEIVDLIFHGFGNDLGNNIGVYDTSKEEKIRDVEDELKQQILENQEIADSVTMILKVALEQRERLVTLLNGGNPHKDISQKEFDRVDIIINALRPMMHAKHSMENVNHD